MGWSPSSPGHASAPSWSRSWASRRPTERSRGWRRSGAAGPCGPGSTAAPTPRSCSSGWRSSGALLAADARVARRVWSSLPSSLPDADLPLLAHRLVLRRRDAATLRAAVPAPAPEAAQPRRRRRGVLVAARRGGGRGGGGAGARPRSRISGTCAGCGSRSTAACCARSWASRSRRGSARCCASSCGASETASSRAGRRARRRPRAPGRERR